jgi:hypothetical protein
MTLNELILNADGDDPMDKFMKSSDLDGRDLACLEQGVNDTLRQAESRFGMLPFRVDAWTEGVDIFAGGSVSARHGPVPIESPVRAVRVDPGGVIFARGHSNHSPEIRVLDAPLHWRIAAVTMLPALAQAHAEKIAALVAAAKKALGS